MSTILTSIPTLVESPFIIATIGGYTFGSYSGKGSLANGNTLNVTYPNFMKSVSITKVNGTVNTYTLNLNYQVGIGQDPNLLDKIFSKATKDRKIKLSYGDWNAPSQIYKEEEAIITNITSSLNLNDSSINYTISCTSDAIGLTSTLYNFPARTGKGSDLLLELINNSRLNLTSVFKGMKNVSKILTGGLIASNDAPINLLPQTNITTLDYMNYIVDSMITVTDAAKQGLPDSKYFLSIHDDLNNEYGGTYFKVTEVSTNTNTVQSTNTYELDVNFPGDNFVTSFSLTNDQSWSILYEYDQEVQQQQYSYQLDNNGNKVSTYAPSLLRSEYTQEISPTKREWWTKMTKFPVQANITIKGLVRPSILMTHVKLNVWFAGGNKHISSGLYIITNQVDTIDSSGYRTTLTLLRVGEDN